MGKIRWGPSQQLGSYPTKCSVPPDSHNLESEEYGSFQEDGLGHDRSFRAITEMVEVEFSQQNKYKRNQHKYRIKREPTFISHKEQKFKQQEESERGQGQSLESRHRRHCSVTSASRGVQDGENATPNELCKCAAEVQLQADLRRNERTTERDIRTADTIGNMK